MGFGDGKRYRYDGLKWVEMGAYEGQGFGRGDNRLIKALVDWVVACPLDIKANSAFFKTDEHGNVEFTPTILFDPTVNPIVPWGSLNPMPVVISVYDPFLQKFVPTRTPTLFDSGYFTTVAAVALHTPPAGMKFRIMGGNVTWCAGLAAAGMEDVNLLDNAAYIMTFSNYLPIAADLKGAAPSTPFDWRPNGYLSSAVNNVFKVGLSVAVTAGDVVLETWGTDE